VRNAWQTVGFVVVAVAASLLITKGPPYRAMDALGLGIAVVAAGCLLWRRSAPLTVLTADAVLVVVNSAAGYSPAVVPWATWIALFTCYSLRGGRIRLVAVAVTLGVGVGGYLYFDRQPVQVGNLFGVAMSFLFAVVAGDAARSRDLVAAAEQARRRAEERTELARELHDSVGHAVNVMVMQAGVGRRVFATNPEFAREALGHIETVGRDALGDLDGLVRVVLPDPPSLTQLAERVRAAGREVQLTAEDVELGAEPSRALHRIAQEAVTNALRHTESGRIDVGLRRVGTTAVLEVVNEGSTLVAGRHGRGLANMRERARRAGGECEAGPFEGGFRVRATLPAAR
jgi:signal transduction histidine kinase